MASTRRAAVCFSTLEYPPDWGGVSKSAQRVARMLADSGYDIHVFAPQFREASYYPAVPNGADSRIWVYRVDTRGMSIEAGSTTFTRAIAEVDERVKFDLFHGFYFPLAFPSLPLARASGRPLIASLRGNDGEGSLWDGPMRDALIAVAEVSSWITSVSTDSLRRLQSFVDVRDRSSFIPNSIERLPDKKWELNASNEGVVGTVCTFRPKKNLPALVEAFAALPRSLRRALRLVGGPFDGDTATPEQIARAIRACSIESEVEISGYVKPVDVIHHLLAMNVFVLCSLHEGFPNTILEAASVGLPIVATSVDGVKDIYGDSQAALLVPPNDSQALAQAIGTVLADRRLAERMSNASLQVAQRFQPQQERTAWLDVYGRALGRP